MKRSIQTLFLLGVVASWGCSSGSGNGASAEGGSPEGSAAADAAEGVDGSSSSSGGGGTDAAAGGTDSSGGGSSGGTIPYAASCGDGGGVPVTPTGAWANATGNLAGIGSECGNLSDMSAKPDEDLLIAGVAQKGLWASKNGGGTWTALGTGSGSATITNRMTQITYDPAHPMTFWESGIYNGGGVYQTTNDGVTLAQLGNVTHLDSVSVDFTDPQRQTLLAGAHEQSNHLLRSTDGGKTWTDLGSKLPMTTSGFLSQVLVIDAMTHLVGSHTYNNSGTGLGIYRTADGGQTWTQVFMTAIQGHPLVMKDGTIYWSVSNGAIIKSVDKGQTWAMTVASGIPATGGPVELPDGRLAAIGPNAVMVSADCGTTWHAATTALPYPPNGLAYSPYEKAFFVFHFDCTQQPFPNDPVPSDAIMKFAFDYRTQ